MYLAQLAIENFRLLGAARTKSTWNFGLTKV